MNAFISIIRRCNEMTINLRNFDKAKLRLYIYCDRLFSSGNV